jgi:hypothetical protein
MGISKKILMLILLLFPVKKPDFRDLYSSPGSSTPPPGLPYEQDEPHNAAITNTHFACVRPAGNSTHQKNVST